MEPGDTRGPDTTVFWVLAIVGLLGGLMSSVGVAVLVVHGFSYVLSVSGNGSVVRVDRGVASAPVEAGRTYGLLVSEDSGMRCRLWSGDGNPVTLERSSASFSVDTPGGRWSGREHFTAPEGGAVFLDCAPVGIGDSVRLVTAPDWSLGPTVLLVALVAIGSTMFLGAGIALVVVVLRRMGDHPPRPPHQPRAPYGPGPPGSASAR